MKLFYLKCMTLLSLSLFSHQVIARPQHSLELWLEPVAPGIVFFKQDRPLAGALMLSGRIISLGAAIHFQNRFNNYTSAERAARVADLYYGPGLRYRDPYAGGYKSSSEFRREADRNLNLSYFAIGSHLLLLGIGMYNGFLLAAEREVEESPLFESSEVSGSERFRHYTGLYGIPGPSISLYEITIPLDF